MKKLLEKIKLFFREVAEKIKDFFTGLWREIVEWAKTPWTKFKKWVIGTAIPWIKAGWLQIVNMIVLFIAYKGFDEVSQPGYSAAIGLWLFILLGYYIFWKLFGFDKVWKKERERKVVLAALSKSAKMNEKKATKKK
jgi:hypothetical protein